MNYLTVPNQPKLASFRIKENSDNISFKESLANLVPKGINNIEDLTVGYHFSVIFNGNSVLAGDQSNYSNSTCTSSSSRTPRRYAKIKKNNHSCCEKSLCSSNCTPMPIQYKNESDRRLSLKKLDFYNRNIYLPSSKLNRSFDIIHDSNSDSDKNSSFSIPSPNGEEMNDEENYYLNDCEEVTENDEESTNSEIETILNSNLDNFERKLKNFKLEQKFSDNNDDDSFEKLNENENESKVFFKLSEIDKTQILSNLDNLAKFNASMPKDNLKKKVIHVF